MGTLRTDELITVSDLPIICWDNIVTATNVDAESDPDFPASNVANPSLSSKWKHDATDSPETATEYFRIDISQSTPINYVAIAGHNFSSQSIAVGLELASWNSPVGDASSVIAPQIPADDGPIIFLFTLQEVEEVRIILTTGLAPAEMAVVYTGQYTVLSEGIQAAHTPLPLARVSDTVSGKSENGTFLGRIVLGSQLSSSATFANLTKTWVREELIPFLDFADESPFFYAWSPSTYDDETAFAWLDADAQPSFDIDGFGEVTLSMKGVST